MSKKRALFILLFVLTIIISACSGNNAGNPASNDSSSAPSENTVESTDNSTPVEDAGDITPEAGAKLLVWDGADGLPFLQEIAKEFTKEFGIPVEVQEQGAPEQMEKMRTDGPAGSGADVLTLPHDNLGQAVAGGYVLPNDFYEEQTRDEYIQAAVDAVSNNGMLYGYPRNMETYALFVNKSLVKDAPLNNWDDIISFAKAFNNVDKNQYGYMSLLNNFYFDYAYLSGFGAYVFGKNGTDPTDIGLNNDGAVQGMNFFRSLKEILPMEAADASSDVKTALFEEGKLAINLDGVWNIGRFSNLGFDVTMIPLPELSNGKKPITFAGVKAYYVSAYTKYPNAAKLFARYVTSHEALLKNFEMTGFIPARKGMENEAAIQKNPMVVGALQQFENAEPMPSIIEMAQVWTPMKDAFELVWKGEDAKKTLDQAVENIKIGIAAQGN